MSISINIETLSDRKEISASLCFETIYYRIYRYIITYLLLKTVYYIKVSMVF